MKHSLTIVIILICALLVVGVSAVPTTNAATMVGNNNITMNAGGAITYPLWFAWGLSTQHESWLTPNMTSGANYTQTGSPLYSTTTYYIIACDATGCGNEVSTMTTSVTPLPVTTLGLAINNVTQVGFNPLIMAQNAMLPYLWLGMPLGVLFGWIFLVIFVAIWIRTRSVAVVSFVGMLSSGCLVSSSVGLKLPLPPEMIAVAQMILYITITACIIVLVKK